MVGNSSRMEFAIYRASIGVAFAALLSAQAIAQQPTATASEQTTGLEEIVVTAQKRDESAQRIPLALSVLSSQDITNHNIKSLSDITFETPGLQFETGAITAYSMNTEIRGISSKGSAEPPVGIYVDGIYESQGAQQAASGAPLGALIDLDRIEVLEGPQGTLYGRNTMAGAINIISKLPTNEFGGSIEASGGNYGYQSYTGVLNLPLTDQIALRVAGQWEDRNGFAKNLAYNTEIDDDHQRVARATLLAKPIDNLTITLRGDYLYAHNGGSVIDTIRIMPAGAQSPIGAGPLGSAAIAQIAGQLGLPFTSAGFAAASAAAAPYVHSSPTITGESLNNNQFSSMEAMGGSATVEYDFGDALQLKSLTGYRRYITNGLEDIDGTPFNLLQGNDVLGYTQMTEELQATGKAFANKLKYAAGLFYFDLDATDPRISIALPSINPLNPNSTNVNTETNSKAAYAQSTYELVDGLNVTAGVRYTEERLLMTSMAHNPAACLVPPADQINGQCLGSFGNRYDNTSYSVGMDYAVTPQTIVYIRNATGFKAGGTNIGSQIPGSYNNFLPETVTDYEAGLKSDWLDHRLRVNADGFFTKYDNIQKTVIVLNTSGGTFAETRNAARQDIYGAELELSASPIERAKLAATVAYTAAYYVDYSYEGINYANQPADDLPKWTYTLSAAYGVPLAIGQLSGELDYLWRAKADLYPSAVAYNPQSYDMQSAYGLLNGRATLSLARINSDISIWGKNLTDKRYFSTITDLDQQLGFSFGVVGPPRTFGVDWITRF
jgi:iron complex outermembrane recepter protein